MRTVTVRFGDAVDVGAPVLAEDSEVPLEEAEGSEGLVEDWPGSAVPLEPPLLGLWVVPPDEGEVSAVATPVNPPRRLADRTERIPTRSARRACWVACGMRGLPTPAELAVGFGQ
jgi:hypothetical protein